MAQPLAIIKTVISKGVTQLGKGSKVASKHAPEILMAIGTGGFVTTVVMAAKAAPTIEETYKTATEEARSIESKPKQLMHISAKVAPVCAPSIIMGAASLGCFFGAHTIQVKRQFALASAYSMLNQTLNTYQDKVIEKFGEEGHDSILGDILADDVETVANDAVEDISTYEGEGNFNLIINHQAIIDLDIVNKPGAVLPTTGGNGTILIYVIGGLMVAIAVVVLIARRKKEASCACFGRGIWHNGLTAPMAEQFFP